MKNWKHCTITGIFVIISFALTACPPEPDPKCECTVKVHPYGSPCTCPVAGTSACDCTEEQHVHAYAATWSKNATQHWHECSCGDKTGVANHTGNPCTVCGYTEPTVPPTCVCPPNTEHPYGTDCPNDCEAKGTEHCGCTIALPPPPCPCLAGTVHDFGTTCPEPCVGVGHEGCNCTIGDEPVVAQTPVPINLTLGESYTATVQGTLTNTQWEGVPARIAAAINNAYAAGIPPVQDAIDNVFALGAGGITIIVEKGQGYTNWKTTSDGKTLYVNIDNLDNLQSNIGAAFQNMENQGNTVGKTTQPAHDNGWRRIAHAATKRALCAAPYVA